MNGGKKKSQLLLYSLHIGLTLLHKYTSTERQRELTKPPCLVHLSSCWGALRTAVSSTAWLGQVCLISGNPSGRRGASTKAFTPLRGVGLLPSTWGAPFKGNADEARSIFRKCSSPAPGPTLKRPCAILIRLVGLKTNTVDLTHVTQLRVILLA